MACAPRLPPPVWIAALQWTGGDNLNGAGLRELPRAAWSFFGLIRRVPNSSRPFRNVSCHSLLLDGEALELLNSEADKVLPLVAAVELQTSLCMASSIRLRTYMPAAFRR